MRYRPSAAMPRLRLSAMQDSTTAEEGEDCAASNNDNNSSDEQKIVPQDVDGCEEGVRETRSGSWKNLVSASVRRIDYKLYATLFLRMLFPTLYSTFRVYILGSMPDASSLSIASQMAWVNVLLEVVQEGLLLPLYHCLGDSLADRAATRNKVKTGFVVSAAVYVCFSAATAALAWPLVRLMAQAEDLQEETVDYVRLELVAIVASSLARMLMLVMILYQWNAMLYAALFVQMASSITLDYLLASEKVADLGVNGVAYSSIGTSCLVLLASVVIVWIKLNFTRSDIFAQYDFGWFRRWTRVGAYSALDSFIRNGVYVVFVIRSMNLLAEQDSYWVCNTFIWSWMLLPALPLADVLKQDISDGRRHEAYHWEKTSGYLLISLAIFLFWIVSYPLWEPFIDSVLKPRDLQVVMDLAILLMPCYAFFALSNLMMSVFYAQGKTELLVLSSMIGNAFLVVLYVLFIVGVIPNTVMAIAGIFGAGLVVGFITMVVLYGRHIKIRGYKL